MIKILARSSKSCVSVRVSGRMTSEDYGALLHLLDKAVAASDRVNLLVLMQDFEGLAGPESVEAGFKSCTPQYRQIEKAAFVSKQKWLEWAVWIMDPITRRTHQRFFSPGQLEEAWQWVEEEQDGD